MKMKWKSAKEEGLPKKEGFYVTCQTNGTKSVRKYHEAAPWHTVTFWMGPLPEAGKPEVSLKAKVAKGIIKRLELMTKDHQ